MECEHSAVLQEDTVTTPGEVVDTTYRRKFLEVPEGMFATAFCPNGTSIRIEKAEWKQSYQPVESDCLLPASFCRGNAVTELLRDRCTYRSHCPLEASRDALGSPCPSDISMRLLVLYGCTKNGEVSKQSGAQRNERIEGSQSSSTA